MADRIVCYTNSIRSFLIDSGIPAERIIEVKLGIDLSMFANVQPGDARARMGVNGEPLVMYTGVLNKFQRIDYLLQAMKVVLQEKPDAKLAFVRTLDDEEHRLEVDRLARDIGVAGSVLYPPVIDFAQLPQFIAAADTTVVPRPDCPGVPVKLLNFMAAGKPVVVTQGSSQGLLDGIEALVTPDHDVPAMANAVLRILNDRELATGLGQRAREVAYTQYDRLAAGRHLAAVYHMAIRDRGRTVEAMPVPMDEPSTMVASGAGS
jgi:glycosyltransferase involved in cell wall biosynthesis